MMCQAKAGPRWLRAGRRAGDVFRVMVVLFCVAGILPGFNAQAQETEQALIRFVHVSPDAPPLDIYMDDQIVVKGVEFPTATAFLAFSAGDHRVQITPAESTVGGALIDINQNLDADTSYEVVAIGLLNDVEGQVYEVDTSVIESSSQARIRIIQGAPSLGGVDVTVEDGDLLFEDVDFPDASDYREVGPSKSNLLLYGTGERDILARLDGLVVDSGWVYDIFIAGQSENETLQFLALKAPAVASCSVVLGGQNPDDGCARFINTSPAAPLLHVHVNDATEQTGDGLAFGEATGFVGLPEGTHRIRVVSNDGTIDEPILDAEIDIRAGEAVEVVLTGEIDSLSLKVYRTSLAPLPAEQTRLRLIHAVQDSDAIDVVMADGATLFESVDYGDASTYAALPAGVAAIEIRVAGEDEALVPLTELALVAGMVYDVVVVGSINGPAGIALSVLESPSVSTMEQEGIQPAGGDAAPPVASPEIVPTATPTPES